DTVTIAAALDSAAAWLGREQIADPAARAEIALTLGAIFGARGRATEHRRMIDSALAIQVRLHDAADPRIGITLTSRAEAMRGEGRLDEAEPMLRRALEILEGHPVQHSRELDHTINMLALSLRDQGRLDEAEVLLRRALPISRGNASDHPLGLHRTLTNLGHVLAAQGRTGQAEALQREVL